MNYWIFQGNPDQYDIDDYLNRTRKVYWSVTVKKYEREIELGDVVFFWRAQGKKKLVSGIVAYGRVVEQCKPEKEIVDPVFLHDELWLEGAKDKSDTKAGILLDEIRLSPEAAMIQSSDFKADPILRRSQIIRARTGSNFKLNKTQATRILSLWEGDKTENVDEEPYVGREGRILYRIHKTRERDGNLKGKLLEQFAQSGRAVSCEICHMEPVSVYGNLGKALLEAHHKIPLSKLPEYFETKIEDLMLVCPTCHRALHQGDAVKNLVTLEQQFKKCDGKDHDQR